MPQIEPQAEQIIPLRIRTRRTLLGNGEVEVTSCITSTYKSQDIALEASPTNRTPLQSLADYTPLAAIMSADVTCVRPDVSVEDLTALLLERGISGVPVVDATGAPIGVVSKTDLVRDRYETGDVEELDQVPIRALGKGYHESRLARRTVADIMLGTNFTLPETATISQACALMAYERVHRVPVTCAQGKVVGIVSSLDVLRWIATRDGYVLPA
jgi:CBS-domain-containing membrane protein